MSLEECAALFRAAKLPHLHDYLVLAFATGARPEAILQLDRQQLDFDLGIVRLNPPGRVQNKKRRPSLPLVGALHVFRDRGAGPLVAYNEKPLASIKTAFRQARKTAGLGDDVTPYTVRHTVATEMRKRSVPVWEIAAWLGHTTGYTTTERYAKISPEALSGAIRAINSFFIDLESLLGRSFSKPSNNPVRATSVLPGLVVVPKDQTKSLKTLVELSGIEPLTSTMPL